MARAQKFTPVRIKAAQRAAKAVELKAAGWTFEEIAVQLGYASASGAANAVSRTMERTAALPAARLRQQMDARFEQAIRAIMPLIEDGDLKAIDSLTKVSSAQMKLWGLDGGGVNDPEDTATKRRAKPVPLPEEDAADILRVLAESGGLASVLPEGAEAALYFLPDGTLAGDDSDIPEVSENPEEIDALAEGFRASFDMGAGVEVLMPRGSR